MGDFDSVFAKFNEKAKRQAAGRRPTSSGGRDEDDEMDELSRRMAELNRAGSQEKPLPAGRPGRGRGRGRSRERDDEGSYWQAPVRQPNGRDRSPDGQRGPSRPPQYDRADYNDYDDDGRGPSRHRNPSADRPPRDLDSAEREEYGRRGRPDHPPAKSARPQGNHARDRDHDRDGDREAPRSCSSDRDPERRRHRDSSCDRSRPGARGHPGERGRVDDRRRPPPRQHDTRDDEEEEDYDVPSSRSQHLDRGHRVNERHQQYRTDHYDDRPRYSRDRRYDGDDSDDEGYESKLERRKREQLQSKIDLLERDLDRYSSRAGDGISTSAREDELERLKREKQLLADKRRVDEESLVRWQRELENKERTVGTTKSASELAREKETAQKHFDRYHYGIDICFLLDCTGSMGSWMRVAGEKVRDVMEIAPEKFPNAVTRIAFVGYRDYGDGDLREEVYDFADADQVDELKRKVLSMKPFGGGDTPEDIAGGLNNATKLNWKSSTRLVIHIADAPCHGTKYHTCRDSHAAGDPSGLVPEDLLRKLCNKSVDYYFVKINALTDQMIAIFEQVYQNSGRSFQVFNIGDNPAEFLPLVIKSVASSISRSEAFKKAPSPTKGLGLY